LDDRLSSSRNYDVCTVPYATAAACKHCHVSAIARIDRLSNFNNIAVYVWPSHATNGV
jgi:hypothetical protein